MKRATRDKSQKTKRVRDEATMAKLGEGDERWIVQERTDGANVHGKLKLRCRIGPVTYRVERIPLKMLDR
eukprot:2470966-Pyramimonas_sp.AAC.1